MPDLLTRPLVGSAGDDDLIHIVQDGVDKRITKANFLTSILEGLTLQDVTNISFTNAAPGNSLVANTGGSFVFQAVTGGESSSDATYDPVVKAAGDATIELTDLYTLDDRKFVVVESDAASQTITLPDTTAADVGKALEVFNKGSEDMTIVLGTNTHNSGSLNVQAGSGFAAVITADTEYTIVGTGEAPTSAIGDLTDVDTTTNPPTDGQMLEWNNAGAVWQPVDAPTGGGNPAYTLMVSGGATQTGTFFNDVAGTPDADADIGDGVYGYVKQFDFNSQAVPYASPAGYTWHVTMAAHAHIAGDAAKILVNPVRILLEPTVQYGAPNISGQDSQQALWVPANVPTSLDTNTVGMFLVPKANESNWVAGVRAGLGYVNGERPSFDIGIDEITCTLNYELVKD